MKGARTRRYTMRLLGGFVGALLFMGTAFAHSVTYDTSLKIRRTPTGVVAPGTRVNIHGRLRSLRVGCRYHSVVRLIKIGTGVVDTDLTGPRGGYAFDRRIRTTSAYRTRFLGKVLNATHPHNHVCGASVSKRLRIPVG